LRYIPSHKCGTNLTNEVAILVYLVSGETGIASGERVELAVEVYTKPVASVELTLLMPGLWLKVLKMAILVYLVSGETGITKTELVVKEWN